MLGEECLWGGEQESPRKNSETATEEGKVDSRGPGKGRENTGAQTVVLLGRSLRGGARTPQWEKWGFSMTQLEHPLSVVGTRNASDFRFKQEIHLCSVNTYTHSLGVIFITFLTKYGVFSTCIILPSKRFRILKYFRFWVVG